MKKTLLVGLVGIPSAIVVILVAGIFWLQTSLPKTSGRLLLPGISAPVSVLRDSKGIPNISAKSDADAYFALGYVHAQDRFWQMETMRRFGAGRLAEIFGEPAIGADRWMRTLGLYQRVERQAAKLDQPVREALQSYARGVNAWIESRSGLPSIEFAVFRYTPEPWKITDSLVWGKIMATRLAGNFRTEVLRAEIAKRLGAKKMLELWPGYPTGAPVSAVNLAFPNTTDLWAGLDDLPPWPIGLPKGASNFWVVGPALTDTGGAMLANDPHLGFAAPIMWYLAKIDTPTLHIMGATVPGVPFHVLGTNGAVAWGITSTEADTEDLFVEKLDGTRPNYYVTPQGAAELVNRSEVIRTKGQPDQAVMIRETRHGPVISDLRSDLGQLAGKDYAIALSATYLADDDQTMSAFYALNRASDRRQFEQALQHVQSPVLNFAYADVTGNIGFRTAGNVPVRRSGSGIVPSPGWNGHTDWSGNIPFAEMPSRFDPTGSRLFNANNRIVGDDYRYFIARDWAEPYRAERIQQLLARPGRISLGRMQDLQNDSVSLMAQEFLPQLLGYLGVQSSDKREVGHRQVQVLLAAWDGKMARDRPEPLIFTTWMRNINKLMYSDELGPLTSDYLTLRPRFIKSALNTVPGWCDDIATSEVENCNTIVTRAFVATIAELSSQFGADVKRWRWGDVHRAVFPHKTLTRVPLINRLVDISISTDGGDYTVNRGATRPNNERSPFAHVHGPGFRGIYDLGNMANSRFMIATGQSGNPLSAHYSDMLVGWRDGKYIQFPGSGESVGAASPALLLVPAQGDGH